MFMNIKKTSVSLLLMLSAKIFCQQFSLRDCIEKAKQNNTVVKLAGQSLETRQKLFKATQNNGLPKLDLLAGYNYIGEPLRVNLQQVKDGIVEGSARQAVFSATTTYQHIS